MLRPLDFFDGLVDLTEYALSVWGEHLDLNVVAVFQVGGACRTSGDDFEHASFAEARRTTGCVDIGDGT